MTPAAASAAAPLAARWRGAAAARPELWVLALCALAWAALLDHGLAAWGHAHHHATTWPGELVAWLAMVVAMMLPLHLDAVRVAAFRSLRRRRLRAVALFLLGYLAPWAALGAAVASLRATGWAHAHALAAAAAAFGIAALWTGTALRRRALVTCHRTVPLAPTGWRADRDCLRFGGLLGAACVASCWATMLGCALTGHDLVAMVIGAAIVARERLSFRTPHRAVLVATAGLAAYYALAAVGS